MTNEKRFEMSVHAIAKGLKEHGPANVTAVDIIAAAGYVLSEAMELIPESSRADVVESFIVTLRHAVKSVDAGVTAPSFGFGTRH